MPLSTSGIATRWGCLRMSATRDSTPQAEVPPGLPGDRRRRVARFTTIYPGWYRGRAVHIHFKIRSPASATAAYEFTSQLFFDDALTDRVHAQQPYAAKGQRDLRNSGDGIYNQGGSELVLTVNPTSGGYAATFDVALENA